MRNLRIDVLREFVEASRKGQRHVRVIAFAEAQGVISYGSHLINTYDYHRWAPDHPLPIVPTNVGSLENTPCPACARPGSLRTTAFGDRYFHGVESCLVRREAG